jgi:hypothetical protein
VFILWFFKMASNNNMWQQVPQFDGKNYDVWCIKMKTIFCSQELWELVENGFPEPADQVAFNALTQAERNTLKENKKKDAKALYFIQTTMGDSIFPRIATTTKSKQAWETLQNAYQGNNKVKLVKLQLLRRDIENLQMKESESVNDFFTRTMSLVNQIRTNGDTLEDQRIIEKTLRSLPPRFDPIVVAIEESKDLTQMCLDELMGSLQIHEQRLNRSATVSSEQAFRSQVSVRGRGKSSNNRGVARGGGSGRFNNSHERGQRNSSETRGRGRSNNNSRGSFSQRYDKSNVQCHYCKKIGHYASECRKKQYDMYQQNENFIKREETESEKKENMCSSFAM